MQKPTVAWQVDLRIDEVVAVDEGDNRRRCCSGNIWTHGQLAVQFYAKVTHGLRWIGDKQLIKKSENISSLRNFAVLDLELIQIISGLSGLAEGILTDTSLVWLSHSFR